MNLSEKTATILESIPYKRWVTSRIIAEDTGYSAREIGATISYDLLNRYVERRASDHSAWEYRRVAV
jgi:hypothetical protein